MKLTSFRVRGFRNFTDWVVLEDLSEINVIHGPNNVGKSNLLQAMRLFFRLLWQLNEGLIFELKKGERTLKDDDLRALDFEPNKIFNLTRPTLPVEFIGQIQLDPTEPPGGSATIELNLNWIGPHIDFKLGEFSLDGGSLKSERSWPLAVEFARRASRSFPLSDGGFARFGYIASHRPIDYELALELYDAKESTDSEAVQRWNRFVEAMKLFADILGEGSFVAIYERKLGRANLLFDTGESRILLELLGSGVQQVAILLGHLLMTKAAIVAIEEPEQNLKYDLQERLRAVFDSIVGKPGGPSQLFLTSHSPAFESGDRFYYMKPTQQGPVVERRSRVQAMAAVGFPTEVPDLPERATLSYVSTDGVVRLHPSVMEAMGLPNGGGVMFVDGDHSVEMMSDARYLERLGLGGGSDGER